MSAKLETDSIVASTVFIAWCFTLWYSEVSSVYYCLAAFHVLMDFLSVQIRI